MTKDTWLNTENFIGAALMHDVRALDEKGCISTYSSLGLHDVTCPTMLHFETHGVTEQHGLKLDTI